MELVPAGVPRAAAEGSDRGAARARRELADRQRLVRVTDEEPGLRPAADHVDDAADGRDPDAVPRRRQIGEAPPAPPNDVVCIDTANGSARSLSADRDDRAADRRRAGAAARYRHRRLAAPPTFARRPRLDESEVRVESGHAAG